MAAVVLVATLATVTLGRTDQIAARIVLVANGFPRRIGYRLDPPRRIAGKRHRLTITMQYAVAAIAQGITSRVFDLGDADAVGNVVFIIIFGGQLVLFGVPDAAVVGIVVIDQITTLRKQLRHVDQFQTTGGTGQR